jgi:hypothetical protein
MKSKHFIFLALSAIILTVAFFAVREKEFSSVGKNEEKIGKNIVPAGLSDKMSAIKIGGGSLRVELRKKNDAWTVSSLYDYPADLSKLRQFSFDLAEMKNTQNINAGISQYARLGLDTADKNAGSKTIEIFADDGLLLFSFIAGKKHFQKNSENPMGSEIPDGRFLLLPGKNEVLVANKILPDLENDAFAWADKTFISADNLKKASFSDQNQVVWTISRKNEGDEFTLENPPDGKEIDKAKLSSIGSALARLSFAKIANPGAPDSESGLDKPKVFAGETFDGIKYEIIVGGKKDSERYAKIRVSAAEIIEPPAPDSETADEKQKREKSLAEKKESTETKAKEENEKFAKWLYLIAENNIAVFITPYGELFKKAEDKNKEDSKSIE